MFHVWVICMTKFTRHKRHNARGSNTKFSVHRIIQKNTGNATKWQKKMQTPSLVELHSTNTVSFNKHHIIPQTANCTCRHLRKGGCWVGAQNLRSMRSYCKTSHIEAAAKPRTFFKRGMHCWSEPGFGFYRMPCVRSVAEGGPKNFLYKKKNMLTYHMI